MGQGIVETNSRKLELIKRRYPDTSPREILTKLLGADVKVDEQVVSPEARTTTTVPITGEQYTWTIS
jgi:hypothetical protein